VESGPGRGNAELNRLARFKPCSVPGSPQTVDSGAPESAYGSEAVPGEVCWGRDTLTQKRHPKAASLALYAEYRYGDSNPGFRTENPAS
jgi:hypothetical protein